MRVFYFTEMPYPDLPPAQTYDSARVTLPNRVCNPLVSSELYNRYLTEWELADAEGLDIMVNEHHQTPTCINAAAPVILGALARTTKRARLLVLGNPIANRRQPIRVAEEMAMIDCMSRGRLECGVIRGVPFEVSPANSNPVNMYERMWEAIDLITKAWTTHDGPFSHEGKYFHHRMVNIWPRPYQQPHPPIWTASSSGNGSLEAGKRGYVLATFTSGYKTTPMIFQKYREGWAAAGRPGTPGLDRLAYAGFCYTGRTDEEGREGGRKILWQMAQHANGPRWISNAPGYNTIAANVMALRNPVAENRASELPHDMDVDEQIEKGNLFCGSVETVVKQIRRFYDAVGGFGNFLAIGQAGFLDHEETVAGIRLLAREVHPRLREFMGASTRTAAE
jgi:alkanesulfonate monooxygenase SsuD/methylene tetrahydromethanopterin reductase-like flavin-dependent oxidoreductase (luciferase family)